jgi:hypothetical protein
MPISEQTKMFRKVPGSFSECSWIILRYLIKYKIYKRSLYQRSRTNSGVKCDRYGIARKDMKYFCVRALYSVEEFMKVPFNLTKKTDVYFPC